MKDDRTETLKVRKWVAYSVVIILFTSLALRFFQVQILRRDTYLKRSEQNRIRQVVVPPPRGLIYDVQNRLIVDNRASFSVGVVPYEVRQGGDVTAFFARALQKDQQALDEKIEKAGRGFTIIKLISQIDYQELALIEEQKLDLPGVVIQTEPRRYYPPHVGSPHLLGSIGEIAEKELAHADPARYQAGDIIGKDGLERFYEEQLRGEKGLNFRQVDALGREIETRFFDLQDQPPVPGRDLLLSLDIELQTLAERLLTDKQGAVVFLDTRNGEVIVQVSKPDYDPNFFSREFTSAEYAELAGDPVRAVLLNRPIAGEYPPGSIFKPVAVLAAINEQIHSADHTFSCGGAFRLGRKVFHCFRGTSHGSLNMRQAIEASCNIYFYRLGLDIGFTTWSRYVHLLGFGQPTGIDLPGEKGGLAPTEAMLVRRYGKNWTSGHMVNMVIGQGDVLVTPLQMARFATIIANEGQYFTPHLVRAVRDNETGTVQTIPLQEHHIEGIAPETWAVLKDGMFNVVQGDRGTARGSRIRGMQFAGKTGSAENPHGNSHAWFIGYAPADTPRVSWAVVVENGGTGGSAAAPIARAILQEIFKEQIQQARQRAQRVRPVVPPVVGTPAEGPPDTSAGDTVSTRARIPTLPEFVSESRVSPGPKPATAPE